MAVLSNNFSGGTPGTNVTVGNSGGASGNAWNSVTRGTDAVVQYDDGGIVFATGTTKAIARTRWVTGSPSGAVAGRLYFKIDAYPNTSCSIVEFANAAEQVVAGKIRINSNGKLAAINTNVTASWTSNAILQVGIKYRLENTISFGKTNGNIAIGLYEGDSLNPIDSVSIGGQLLGVDSVDVISFGWLSGVANLLPLHMYDVKVNNTGAPIGPAQATVSSSDTINAVELNTLIQNGLVAKEDLETRQLVDSAAVLVLPSISEGILFGSTCFYEAEGMTQEASWDRFTTDLGIGLDFFHGYSGNTVPTIVNSSAPVKLALASGHNLELNIKTDWANDTQGVAHWLSRLDSFLYNVALNAPNMKIHFVLNHEPENGTVKPTDDLGTAKVQAARWRFHVLQLARRIWSYQNPNWSVGLVFMAFNSTVQVNNGKRVSRWLPAEAWVPAFVGDETGRVVLGIDAYPRLDTNGDPVDNFMNVDQTMHGQTRAFDNYASFGFTKFAFSEFGYNCNAIGTTRESKVRDAIRGYAADGTTVPGSLGEYLLNPSHKIVRFSWYERSFASGDDPAAGGLGYLATSATKMSGYRDLIAMTRSRVTP